jgi:ribonuclease BN (tRNA processing enzyme)
VVESFEWDRVGGRGPKFEIRELEGDVLRRFRIQVGKGGVEPIDVADCGDGIVLDEPRFLVSAVELDHAGLPVLAYALRESSHFDVRADLLREHGWKPGRWLGTLKKHAAAREASELIELPDGTSRTVGELADLLLIETEGQKIVYATDFGDTPGNREAVVQLARGAQILVCEASFVQEDVEQAERTGHLTARACGEIAAAAGVERLVPFHFSSRYDQCPERVYAEILEVFEHTLVPSSLWKALE